MEKVFNFKAIVAILLILATPVLGVNLIEVQDASELMVIQSVTGELHVFTEPGPHWQGLGTVTTYPRQKQYMFDINDSKDTSIKLQFNDGGLATLSGSVNWEMPIDEKSIIKIHKAFGSEEAVESRAVVKMLDAATYLAGPLMSSIESAGERRSELVNVINDQAELGVYVTKVISVTETDDLTKLTKTRNITKIQRNKDGTPKRQQGSILQDFNIRLQPISIKLLDYDDVVDQQIKDRQKSTTAVQLSIAAAKKAAQDAITAEEQGKADAATAKWKQETIKAQRVTEAEQQRDVARLAKEEAEFFKAQQILIGEGEATRKRLVMEADGALEPKLETYKEVNAMYAKAIANYKGNWVPSIVMSGQGGETNAQNGAQDFINLMTIKTAKDLNLDLSLPKN